MSNRPTPSTPPHPGTADADARRLDRVGQGGLAFLIALVAGWFAQLA